MVHKAVLAALAALVVGSAAQAADPMFVYRYKSNVTPTAAPPATPTGGISGSVTGSEDTQPAFVPVLAVTPAVPGWDWSGDARITGLPAGFSFSSGSNAGGVWTIPVSDLRSGSVRLVPAPHWSGAVTASVSASLVNADDGRTQDVSGTVSVSIDPVADAGTISGSRTGSEDGAILFRPSYATPDSDGSETWSTFSEVTGLPAGATLSQGSEASPGVWMVQTSSLRGGSVAVRPPASSDADFTLTVSATLTDSGNGKTVSRVVTGNYPITVLAVADPPIASANDVNGGMNSWIPLDLSASLSDADGSETLETVILGLPTDAALSVGTKQADGSWTVNQADLPTLQIQPPANFVGTLSLTLRARSTEASNGQTGTTVRAFNVNVN